MLRNADNPQREHWSAVYARTPEFFGEESSSFARRAMEAFRQEGVGTILELGFGQGRDTLWFAGQGLRVEALDYSPRAVEDTTAEARARGLGDRVSARLHDVRQPLPYPDDSFDACYSHMLLCMELTEREVAFSLAEMHRVLRPGGLALYSVRSDRDVHCGTGTHLGEAIYEVGGFVVHFFSESKVRRLAWGFDVIALEHAEEGALPRALYLVTLRQDPDHPPPLPPTETAAIPVSEGEIQSLVLCDGVEGGTEGVQKKNATRPPGGI